MEDLFVYCLCLFWGFFLLNYAEITAFWAAALKQQLGPTWGYPLGCGFCWGFWTTLGFWLMGIVPASFLLAAPVIHLFIDLAFDKLSGGKQSPVVTPLSGVYGDGNSTTTLP